MGDKFPMPSYRWDRDRKEGGNWQWKSLGLQDGMPIHECSEKNNPVWKHNLKPNALISLTGAKSLHEKLLGTLNTC